MLKTQETVPFLFLPTGFPREKKSATWDAIGNYRACESNPLKKLPFLLYGGAIVLAASVLLGLNALRKKDKEEEWLSSTGGTIGLGMVLSSLIPFLQQANPVSTSSDKNKSIHASGYNSFQRALQNGMQQGGGSQEALITQIRREPWNPTLDINSTGEIAVKS